MVRQNKGAFFASTLSKVLTLVLVGVAQTGHASYMCEGRIHTLNQPYEGSVIVESVEIFGSAGGRTVCNVAGTWKGISERTCRGWLSKLLLVKALDKPIRIQYNDATSTCSQQPVFDNAGAPWALME